nr:retrovirus-related Pol polyprotein from transposon TNT 1-94 [Tanacetum cinerariifolium]
HPKVTKIKESKDLSTLSLDELISNLKVYEVVLEKDLEVSKNKKEKYKSLALKSRQVLSEYDASSSDSNDKEYAMTVRDFKKFFRRRGKFVRQPYNDKKNLRKTKEDKKEKEDRRCFKCGDPNHFISDCLKHSFGYRTLGRLRVGFLVINTESFFFTMLLPRILAFSVFAADSRETVLFARTSWFSCKGNRHRRFYKEHFVILRAKFLILLLLVEAISSVYPNPYLSFNGFCISTILRKDEEPKNVKEAIEDESWTMAMQEELNQFKTNVIWSLVPPPRNQTIIDNTLFTKKRNSHIIIVQIYVDDIIFGSTYQELCDDFSKIMHDEFEMSMMGELNFFLGLQIKQLEDGIFFNQSKYVKEMLTKFGLEDSKPIITHMSSETKLTRDEDGEPIDDTKYHGMIGIMVKVVVVWWWVAGCGDDIVGGSERGRGGGAAKVMEVAVYVCDEDGGVGGEGVVGASG